MNTRTHARAYMSGLCLSKRAMCAVTSSERLCGMSKPVKRIDGRQAECRELQSLAAGLAGSCL